MVTVNFKLSDIGTVLQDIAEPERLEKILEQCAAKAGVELGGIIAVRNGKVLATTEMVEPTDEIDIFPAISGG